MSLDASISAPAPRALDGRVAIVTGGNRGIGAAIALAFASAGADVAILARDMGAADGVAREIEQRGRAALAIHCDVTRAEQVQTAVQRVLDRFGRLDVLVNNAGASPHDKPFLDISAQEWDAVIAVNLTGPALMCRAAGPALLRRSGASVINIVSIAADTPIPGESVYSAAKAGLVSLTRSLAQEWSAEGVRVNAIAPGYVMTEINRGVWGLLVPYMDANGRVHPPESPPDEATRAALGVYARTVSTTPLGRYGTPAEIADLAVFLASDAAAFITGSTFYADGGWQARR